MPSMTADNGLCLVESLLGAGADVNWQDIGGNTALHHALELPSFTSCKELLELLLSWGADINARNEDDNTALHVAAGIDLQYRQYEHNLEKTRIKCSAPFENDILAPPCQPTSKSKKPKDWPR